MAGSASCLVRGGPHDGLIVAANGIFRISPIIAAVGLGERKVAVAPGLGAGCLGAIPLRGDLSTIGGQPTKGDFGLAIAVHVTGAKQRIGDYMAVVTI